MATIATTGVYPFPLVVAGDKDYVRKSYKYPDGTEITDGNGMSCASTMLVKDRKDRMCVLVYIDVEYHKDKELSEIVDTIAHEATHAADYYFRELGIKHDLYNNEPYAYLVGWIAGIAWDTFKDKFEKK